MRLEWSCSKKLARLLRQGDISLVHIFSAVFRASLCEPHWWWFWRWLFHPIASISDCFSKWFVEINYVVQQRTSLGSHEVSKEHIRTCQAAMQCIVSTLRTCIQWPKDFYSGFLASTPAPAMSARHFSPVCMLVFIENPHWKIEFNLRIFVRRRILQSANRIQRPKRKKAGIGGSFYIVGWQCVRRRPTRKRAHEWWINLLTKNSNLFPATAAMAPAIAVPTTAPASQPPLATAWHWDLFHRWNRL